MMKRLLKHWTKVFVRRGWYCYDFLGADHRTSWVLRYLAGGFLTDWVSVYEQAVARAIGLPHAITFGAGRMAFYAALEALGVGPGDEVIVPGYTCVVVPNAILYRGATPRYVDICRETFNMDPRQLEQAITPRTKVIVAQHTFGRPCEIDAITEIARRHRLVVIEDCAHAVGGSFRGQRLGTFGDVAFVSTDQSKVFSTSLGGAVCCASPPLAEKLRTIQQRSAQLPWWCRVRITFQYGLLALLTRPSLYWASQPFIQLLQRLKVFFWFRDELHTQRPPYYPARLSNVQAFIGWHVIQALQSNVRHRQAVARRYAEILHGAGSVRDDGVWARYSLLVPSPQRWERALEKYFVVGRWFSSVSHGRADDWAAIHYTSGQCPIAEFVAEHIVNFPTHGRIDERALRRFHMWVERLGFTAERLSEARRG
ncbi:MAG: hypothetical protein A3G88_04050 [Omnitrophica WOR_2 bacterium RIFCSPLOWO2_12_FULL_63_16]|nr:MAG: hypothetical protein A3G88_04050 [Omnitrophica WOR_2 bacterium RIFCSPLOWO2_12_FULL_63_16]